MDYHYPSYIDVDMNVIYKDINQAIYMLHYLEPEVFSQREIRDICFSLKITLNTLERMMENGKLLEEWKRTEVQEDTE